MKPPEISSDDLNNCRRLLSDVAESTAAVRCFRLRWSAIAATVDRLADALTDLAADAALSSLVTDFLSSLAETLTLTLSLSDQCLAVDPPAGKLRTQSDLLSAAAALDRLASDADVILRSSAEKPESGDRAAVRGLVTRLQIGGASARLAALDALLTMLHANDKNTSVASAQGAIPALLRLIDSPATGDGVGRELREMATAAIARLSSVDGCRPFFAAESAAVLGHLGRVLESEVGAAKENACVALQTLTLTRDGAASIGSLGCVAALLGLCTAGTPAAQAAAAGVIKNLSRFRELRQNLLDENSVPVLVRVLASGTPLAQENVVECLRSLSDGEESENSKIAIFSEGVLEGIKIYLECDDAENRNLKDAIGLLRNLASFRYIAEIVVSKGFVPWIVAAVDSASSGARTEAAKMVADFARMFGKNVKEFGEALPLLVQMLEAKAMEEMEAAVIALASLLMFTTYRKLFKKEERGIANVVQLLDPTVRGVDKKYVVSVLVLLSQSRKCRKRMVEAGACKFLQRLAEMEVDGAKRLLEILDKRKIWGVFQRT